MKKEITTIEEFESLDLTNFEINDDVEIIIRLKLIDKKITKPIQIIHSKPNLTSNINIKIALYGNSSIEMPVEILVNKGATGTSTNFKATIFLMSDKAKANVTPGLFIHEKDILSAGHGVIIKNIKEKDTLYLQSRGIEKTEAREMVVGL